MINNVVLIGRLVRDPELRRTERGKAVVSFTLACNKQYNKEQTDFIPVVCWDKLAENVSQYVSKGNLVGVDGSLQSRSYKDKEGHNRTVLEVLARSVQFLESKKQSQENYNQYGLNEEDIEF